MSNSPGLAPKLGASYYPGGFDDYEMPELISPAPQRIMPEVPSNMQEGLAHLELEAREVRHDRLDSVSSVRSPQTQYRDPLPSTQRAPQPAPQSQTLAPNDPAATYDHSNAALYQNAHSFTQGYKDQYGQAAGRFVAKPSPFPKPHVLPNQRVPPSNNEQEAILITHREEVLNSNNAEMQLAWAQDTLLWIDNETQSRARLAEVEVVRPGTPNEDQLRKDAVNIVNFLADQRHPKALFIRATWYEFGKFEYPTNRDEAIQGYRLASERGYARAEYRIGTIYESMQDMVKAIKHYKAGVAKGDAASSYRFGMMSLLGQHAQALDQQLGVQRIKYAAEMADENAAQGAYVYGMLLVRDLPNINIPEALLPIDIDQARDFIEKAAFLGFGKAQLKMGSAYELCQLGCDFNPALSLHYNALAAHQGDADADMSISKWFLCGYEDVFSKNEELAFTYARRAAQIGLPTAEFAMGYFYEIGMYVPSDLMQAKYWYQRAADHGNKDAGGRLESISQQKTLSKEHEKEAIKRIRSQYGSQRGKRPDRFKEKPMPMLPTVEEPVEKIDMPDPDAARRSVSSPVFMISPIEAFPATTYSTVRPKSTAPYPEEDIHHPPIRTTSTAPYPEDNVVHSRYNQIPSSTQRNPHVNPQVRPQQGPVADRPLSAFGIRPEHMSTPNQLGSGFNRTGPQLRPATSMGNMYNNAAIPEGRGSNPAGRNQVISAGWEPKPALNYRQPSPYQNPLPPIDTGRLQPVNSLPINPNAGRNKLHKPSSNVGKPQPSNPPQTTPNPGYPITPIEPLNYRKSSGSAPASQTRYDAPNSNAIVAGKQFDARSTLPSNIVQRPPRMDSMNPNAGPTSQRPNLTQSSSAPINPQRLSSPPSAESFQHPPRTSSAAPTVSAGNPSGKSSVARPISSVTSSQPGKPSKGPQTFEEMGIETAKNESDCVIM